MSIFEKEPNVTDNQWHYKLLDKLYSDTQKPKTQCSYFWTVVLALITSPFWVIGYIFTGNSRDLKEMYGMSVVSLMVVSGTLYLLLGAIYGISLAFGHPIIPDEVVWKMVDEKKGLTGIGAIVQIAFLVDISMLILLFVIGIGKVLKLIWFAFYDAVSSKVEFVKEREIDEEEYDMLDSFIGWFIDTKNKVCKPINYIKVEKEEELK